MMTLGILLFKREFIGQKCKNYNNDKILDRKIYWTDTNFLIISTKTHITLDIMNGTKYICK